MATKWGVYSSGKICHDFVTSVRSLKTNDHQFVAVAARSLASAQAFAKTQEIPKAYGTYEELAKDPDVEVVYIGTINSEHLSAAKLMLENGKHILIEKPIGLNEKQTKELFDLAKSKKLFAMEAMWSRFLPSYEFLTNQLSKGVIGDVYHIYSGIGYRKDVQTRALGGGSVLDIGIYNINVTEEVYNSEEPEQLVAVGDLNRDGVDLEFSAAAKFSGNRTATFTSSTKIDMTNEAIIEGAKGTIRLAAPFQGTQKVTVNGQAHEFKFPDPILTLNYGSTGLCYQANEVRACIKSGLLESTRNDHYQSLLNARLRDNIRKQLGTKYDADQ